MGQRVDGALLRHADGALLREHLACHLIRPSLDRTIEACVLIHRVISCLKGLDPLARPGYQDINSRESLVDEPLHLSMEESNIVHLYCGRLQAPSQPPDWRSSGIWWESLMSCLR